MSDFLQHLVTRFTSAEPACRPRLPSLFEPVASGQGVARQPPVDLTLERHGGLDAAAELRSGHHDSHPQTVIQPSPAAEAPVRPTPAPPTFDKPLLGPAKEAQPSESPPLETSALEDSRMEIPPATNRSVPGQPLVAQPIASPPEPRQTRRTAARESGEPTERVDPAATTASTVEATSRIAASVRPDSAAIVPPSVPPPTRQAPQTADPTPTAAARTRPTLSPPAETTLPAPRQVDLPSPGAADLASPPTAVETSAVQPAITAQPAIASARVPTSDADRVALPAVLQFRPVAEQPAPPSLAPAHSTPLLTPRSEAPRTVIAPQGPPPATSPPAPPTINVTIGRVEVTAAPAPTAPRRTHKPASVMTLEAYLRQSAAGGGG